MTSRTKQRILMVTLLMGLVADAAMAGERILRTEALVHAPASEVWKAFTTKEGIQSWMVPVAEIDLRLGGTLKTHYSPQAKIGDPGTIVHHILSYEPERMLATQFTAPEGAPPEAKLAQQTWVVYRLEPLSARETRVTVSMMGWGEGPEWDRSYAFFERGNAWEMEQLVKRFALKPAKPESVAPPK